MFWIEVAVFSVRITRELMMPRMPADGSEKCTNEVKSSRAVEGFNLVHISESP